MTKPATRTAFELLLAMIVDARDFEQFQTNARAALDKLDAQWEAHELDNWPVLPEEPERP